MIINNTWKKPKRLRKVLLSTETPFPRVDGISNLLRNLLPFFIKAEIEVLLCTPTPKDGLNGEYSGFQIFHTGGIMVPGYRDTIFGIPSFSLVQNLIKFAPDIVHTMGPFALGSCIIRWANKAKIPRLASFNTNLAEYGPYYKIGFLSPMAWLFFRYIHSYTDLNLAPSKSVKELMERNGIPRTTIWGRGVDCNQFRPEKRNHAMQMRLTKGNPDRKIILYVGRLAREKNLEILHEITQGIQGIQLVFVGDGPRRQALERLFVERNVTFMGFLNGDELARAYAASDVFVFPSLTEGFANTVLESLASGLPVVGFDSYGVKDLVEQSGAGYLAPCSSPSRFRSSIIELIDSPLLRKEFAMKGIKFARSKTWENCFLELMTYYESVFDTC